MKIPRELTNSLRGLAIIAVVSSHFARGYLPEVYSTFLGNHFVSFFFILSGLGLYFSLEKTEFSGRGLARFYYKRFARIYPLFWLYYLLNVIVLHESFTISDFLLVRYADPRHAWFLCALIPCYLLSPLLFLFIRKTNNKSIVIVFIFFVALNIISPMVGVPGQRCWTYRGVYYGNIILFYLGMYFAKYMNSTNKKFNRNMAYILFVIMMFVFVETSDYEFLGLNHDHKALAILFYIASSMFLYFFLQGDRAYPLVGLLKRIGTYSLGLYLYEGAYNLVLAKAGIISGRSLFNFIPWLLLYPVFIPAVAFLEELFSTNLDFKKSFVRVRGNFFEKKVYG